MEIFFVFVSETGEELFSSASLDECRVFAHSYSCKSNTHLTISSRFFCPDKKC